MEIQKSQLDIQIDKLLERQKNSRSINDHNNSATILKAIAQLCYDVKNYDKLCQMVILLMKKRGQPKKAQIELVQLVMSWLPAITDNTVKSKVIETVKQVTDKKIFLEVQYARCVLLIVKNKQDSNNINEAAKILQQVQVETYGSMDRRQKLQFILYQMRIMIKRQDYVRFFIISKKINQRNLNDDKIVDLKIQFYSYMAIYYNHQNRYFETSRCYKTIWETLKATKQPQPQRIDFNFSINYQDVLSNYVGFLVLHIYNVETYKELQELRNDQQIQNINHIYTLVKTFLSKQIVNVNIQNYNLESFELFTNRLQNYENHKTILRKMLIQHNIRIMSYYYERLKLARMAALIGISSDQTEDQLCQMMNIKLISCHVDRLDGNIDFKPPKNENIILQNWNESINNILNLIDKASNLIHKQNEILNH